MPGSSSTPKQRAINTTIGPRARLGTDYELPGVIEGPESTPAKLKVELAETAQDFALHIPNSRAKVVFAEKMDIAKSSQSKAVFSFLTTY